MVCRAFSLAPPPPGEVTGRGPPHPGRPPCPSPTPPETPLMRYVFLTFAFLLFVSDLPAQNRPRVTLVQPAGGKAGTTVDVAVVGNDFDGAEGLHFDFPGAKVEVQQAEKIDDKAP